ncbi:hypothetical protein E4U52_005919 [Claviceps spartinae]|nr:hypothetical protein E4U52_005919 [Claviceps spartinae]
MSAVCLSSVAGTQVRFWNSFQRSSTHQSRSSNKSPSAARTPVTEVQGFDSNTRSTLSPFEWRRLANGSETEQRYTRFVEPGRIRGGSGLEVLGVLRDVMNQYDRKMNILNTHARVHLAELTAEYGGCPMHIVTHTTWPGEAKFSLSICGKAY